MKNVLLYVLMPVFLMYFGPAAAVAEEEPCSAGQTRVCYVDGGESTCICKAREVVMSDTVENISNCYDPDDEGVCGEAPPDPEE